jgi:uncharacterized UPF0160 family protein
MRIGLPLSPEYGDCISFALLRILFPELGFIRDENVEKMRIFCSFLVGIGYEYNHKKKIYHWGMNWKTTWEMLETKEKDKANEIIEENKPQLQTTKNSGKEEENGVFTEQVYLGTAGLVWFHYGKEIIQALHHTFLTQFQLCWVHSHVYHNYIIIADAYQHRISPFGKNKVAKNYDDNTTIEKLLEKLSPEPWVVLSKRERDNIFVNMMEIVNVDLISYLKETILSTLPAFDLVRQAYFLRPKGERFFYCKAPFEYVLGDVEEIDTSGDPKPLFVISQRNNTFNAIAIKKFRFSSGFEYRCRFPEEWRGLRGKTLINECGFKAASFVHAAGFLAACYSSKELEEMIRIAIKVEEEGKF